MAAKIKGPGRRILLLALALVATTAAAAPVPPCAGRAAAPDYGALNGPPAVGVWRDVTLALGGDCPAGISGEMALVVALAGRFRHAGGLDDLAARIGAISATEGTPYWSVTDGAWRPLISQAYAVEDPAAGRRRPDFSAAEVLSGRTLHLVQDDTRSSGLNLYSLAARATGPDRLTVEIVNLSTIRFLLAPLFREKALVSAHFLRRQHGDVWGYYGLTVVRKGALGGQEKSLVNRAAAFYRFLIGVPADRDPPLAP